MTDPKKGLGLDDSTSNDSVEDAVSIARSRLHSWELARAENDIALCDALMQELRDLAAAFGDNSAVREQLVKGLLESLDYANEIDDSARSRSLLQEIRDLEASLKCAASRSRISCN